MRRLDQIKTRRGSIRWALAIAVGASSVACVFAIVGAPRAALLAVLVPGLIIACFVWRLAAASADTRAAFERNLEMTSMRPPARSVVGYQWGQTMTVCRCHDRWFLENEWGELMETSFEDIVEWVDTLWDIRQLALAGPDPEPAQTILLRPSLAAAA